MMDIKNFLLGAMLVFFSAIAAHGQTTPIILEAESGTLGADFLVASDGDIDYVTSATDFLNTAYPGSEDKVITFEVTFPVAGTYSLYGRVRVGSATFDDDSYFYANGFGAKNPTTADDWMLANGLAAAGFTDPDEFVSGTGGIGSEVWKWVNFADFDGGEAPITFTVEEGSLTQTFQVGGREDGLDIDKFAFARSDYYYRVLCLDEGGEGFPEIPGSFIPTGPPLADGQTKFLGNVYSQAQLPYYEMYWNQVTPENAGKWGSVEGTRDNMNWGELDIAYNLAKDNDFFYRHHVLVWGNQQPGWMAALDSTEQYAEIQEWFSGIANRYDSIDQVEVVNEPLHDPPDGAEDGGYIGALGGSGTTGWDWIINAFRLARTHFPNSELMINEYSIVNDPANLNDYLEIIDLLQAEDTLIDAIGIQCHAFSTGTSSSRISDHLDQLAATGLPVYVTEMDVDGLEDEVQLRSYQRLFPIFWEHPGVHGITIWGYRMGCWRTAQGAYILRNDGSERPSTVWLRAYIEGTLADVSSVAVTSAGDVSTIETDDGTLQMIATILPEEATIKDVAWSVSNQNLATIGDEGMLTALDNGTVTVTARAIDGTNEEGSMDITISNQVPNSVNSVDKNTDISIYPNPSQDGIFTIDGIELITSISVMNMGGHLIEEMSIFNQSSVDLSLNLDPGIYIIKLSEKDNVYYKKIIVN